MSSTPPPSAPPPGTPQPGWYPDPNGRFEYRYFNGERWTSDVSMHGQRYIDSPTAPGQPRPSRALAITAFVLAVSSLLLAWVPFVFILAVAGAICAVVFGVLGLRAARQPGGAGRALAITGLVVAPVALALCTVGFLLTRVVLREVDEYLNPGPYELVEDLPCTVDSSTATFSGTIRNLDDSPREYVLSVEYRTRGDVEKTGRIDVGTIQPGETFVWTTTEFVPGSQITCRVVDVLGPDPFGIDPG